MKLIVHIGTEKTGTTTIQSFLTLNKDLFLSNKIYIPNVENHWQNHRHFEAICQDELDDFFWRENIYDTNKQKKLQEKIKKEIFKELEALKDSEIDTVVISSEHFHSRYRSVEEIQCFKNTFSNYFKEFEIIVYIRNQADMMQSYYSTALKSGMIYKSFEDFVLQELRGNRYYYDYYRFIKNWADVFGVKNLKIRIFDKKEFKNGDLLDDFINVISGALYQNIKNKYKIPEKLNESLNIEGERLLKIINKNLKRFSKDGLNNDNVKLSSIISNYCKGKLKLLDKDLAKKIMNEFNESNEKIKEVFFPEKEKLFDINFDKFVKSKSATPQCVLEVFEKTVNIIKEKDEIENSNFKVFNEKKIILLDGFYSIEKWGVWSKGDEKGKFLIIIPKKFYELAQKLKIKFDIQYLPKSSTRTLIKVNNQWQDMKEEIVLNYKFLERKGGSLFFELKHEKPKSPKELGINDDTRIMGCGVKNVTFEEII